MSSILLQNGTLIVFDNRDQPQPVRADVLVKGNVIFQVGQDLKPLDTSTTVIDCTDKIVTPGLIDTHHHMWQTQLKGRFADATLFDYFYKGWCQWDFYAAEDIFWGELASCIEALDSGTTTVVDHAHCSRTPDHATQAISATVTSGLRSFFCYAFVPEIKSWSPQFVLGNSPAWANEFLKTLAQKSPFGPGGRVRMGLAFDQLYLPKDTVREIIGTARQLNLFPLTAHAAGGALQGFLQPIQQAHDYGLLGPDWIFSHGGWITHAELELLKQSGATISVTPESELQMGHPMPPIESSDYPSLRDCCSIGIDCSCSNSGDIVTQMRLMLQSGRGIVGRQVKDKGKVVKELILKIGEVYAMATIRAARSLKLNAGQLKEGALADIVVYDTLSPSMIAGAAENPVAAIMLHSSVRDVNTVIVDGIIRKRHGKLLPIELDADASVQVQEKVLGWNDVAQQVLRSRLDIEGRMKDVDFSEPIVAQGIKDAFHLSDDVFM
ncbi:Metallo-dependent hydrolase [Guyanagaster necrorhizus]|uniref:Metallo-dependent hydrolase n=1 Tax=Guyanagaster necrorhizus TaxID=856835 RepID=A0A9P8AP79_9AGAR|nr:Metallo-dependent hydrolase [Guyanagaster necrorhizus MCA 3950]KAG7442670.1 Metallo-dependent hydrolase [Guyanagaster necrorhizus MCA 3950]